MDLDGWDDELSFNTQMSSQWDSLCHVTHGTTPTSPGETYNGFRPTQAALQDVPFTALNPLPTIDHWHARGCIVGRGVLIDYKGYLDTTSPPDSAPYHPLDGHRITVAEIEAVAKHQRLEFRPGDILLVRTGYTEMLAAPTAEDFGKFAKETLSGVHGAEETVRWAWNRRFAAVAGDAHAFEALPPLKGDGETGTVADLCEFFWGLFYSVVIRLGLFSVVGEIERLKSNMRGDRSSSVFPQWTWDAYRRAVGSQGAERAVQEAGAV